MMDKIFIVLSLLFGLMACDSNNPERVTNLRVEYLKNPFGVETTTPRFSWIITDPRRGATQTGYHLIVTEDTTNENSKNGIFWETEMVASVQSLNIPYAGPDLESGKKYFYKVRIRDQDGIVSNWSDWGYFQMGLIYDSDKKANWITVSDTSISSPLLRNVIDISKEIASAYAYASAIGYYEFYLNGKKVGDHLIDPAMTDFRKRVLYATYDITNELVKGKNALGLWLGNGGYRVGGTEGRWSWYGSNYSYGPLRGWLQVDVTYVDGTGETFITDENWRSDASPVIHNDVYGGEDYDARLEQVGWSTVGFDDKDWEAVAVADHPGVKLESQLMPAVRITRRFEPVATTRPDSSSWLFDFGQNFAGVWAVHVSGEPGAVLKIKGAETLNDSLFPEPLTAGDRLSMDKVYHREVWSAYTLKGEGTESFHPRFFYSGFRYLEVVVEGIGDVHSVDAEGLVIHNDLKRNGYFESSDSLLNRIYRAAVWSQKSNTHGYPTDCPHREKGGYNGDGQIIAETSIHDFHMHSFYVKWLNDMRDAQYDNGRIPNTSPDVIGGIGGGIAWGSAYILLPMWMYEYYDDRQLIEDHYPTMKKYMTYLHHLAANDDHPEEVFIINEFGGHWDSLGEWEAPVGDRNGPVNPLTNTYYWYLNARIMTRIAEELGEEEDAKVFQSLTDSIKKAFNKKFYLKDLHLYGTEYPYQSYLLFALNGHLVPEKDREAVLGNLIEDIMVKSHGHLGTGILGTKHLFPVLAKAGRQDVIHTMVTQTTFPSWGYWIDNGATTLWENWKGENSHNHQMFGTVNEYFYKYLAGIRPPGEGMTTNGYKHIHIEPYLPENLDYARASIESVRGKIKSAWEKTEDGLEFNITIPANTTGIIALPFDTGAVSEVWEGNATVWEEGEFAKTGKIPGVVNATIEGDRMNIDIGSGSYRFSMRER